jgi:hypothetical protein
MQLESDHIITSSSSSQLFHFCELDETWEAHIWVRSKCATDHVLFQSNIVRSIPKADNTLNFKRRLCLRGIYRFGLSFS